MACAPHCTTPHQSYHYVGFILADDKAVWKEILRMKDPVHLKYHVIEELFCQKKKEVKPEEDKLKKKQSAQVAVVSLSFP